MGGEGWEQIYNPAFKVVEFDHFKSEAGLHTFVLSVSEWIEKTEAIGLFVKRGKYGGKAIEAMRSLNITIPVEGRARENI